MAVEERNEVGGIIGGRPVSLVVKKRRAGQGKRPFARTGELIREGVVAIIGHTTSTMFHRGGSGGSTKRGADGQSDQQHQQAHWHRRLFHPGWFRPGKTRPCILPDMLTKGRVCAKSPCCTIFPIPDTRAWFTTRFVRNSKNWEAIWSIPNRTRRVPA